MADSVRFYSTNVAPEKSLSEVVGLLRKYGAQRFEQMWDGFGHTSAIRFNLPTPEAAFGHIDVILRPKTDVLADKLWQAHRIDDDDQVERVAWRQLKGILEGILLAADTGMFSPAQLLLGMGETFDQNGNPTTVWESMKMLDSLPLALPPVVEAELIE